MELPSKVVSIHSKCIKLIRTDFGGSQLSDKSSHRNCCPRFISDRVAEVDFVLCRSRFLWWMNLTQSAIQKHIIYLMHFFSCFNFAVDSPLTKSIFGEHAIIISIHWIVMDLNVVAEHEALKWSKRKAKIVCSYIHGVKRSTLTKRWFGQIYRIKASFTSQKRKDLKKRQMKCLSYPTGLLVSQQQVHIYTILKVFSAYLVIFFAKNYTKHSFTKEKKFAVHTLTEFMNYWKLHRCRWLFLFVLKVHPNMYDMVPYSVSVHIYKRLKYGKSVWIHLEKIKISLNNL